MAQHSFRETGWPGEGEAPGFQEAFQDYYKAMGDQPDTRTEAEFEEECDAVNHARASKIRESGYSTFQRVLG